MLRISLVFLLLLSGFVLWQYNSVNEYDVYVKDKKADGFSSKPVLKIITDKGMFFINYVKLFNTIHINHCYKIKTWGTDHLFYNVHIEKIKEIDCESLDGKNENTL